MVVALLPAVTLMIVAVPPAVRFLEFPPSCIAAPHNGD
jgi:hypothetical protein